MTSRRQCPKGGGACGMSSPPFQETVICVKFRANQPLCPPPLTKAFPYAYGDKYLVVSINDIMCQLRKFTTSQFRSETYDVRLSDCFPVVSTALLQEHDPGPIRGLQDVDDCAGATRSEPCILSPTADMSSSIRPEKSLRPTLGHHPPLDTGTRNLTQLSQSEVCSPTPLYITLSV